VLVGDAHKSGTVTNKPTKSIRHCCSVVITTLLSFACRCGPLRGFSAGGCIGVCVNKPAYTLNSSTTDNHPGQGVEPGEETSLMGGNARARMDKLLLRFQGEAVCSFFPGGGGSPCYGVPSCVRRFRVSTSMLGCPPPWPLLPLYQ